jgi:glutamate dehydrogenase (NAD(P)+)
MAWIKDTFENFDPQDSAGCVTGKPVEQGGIRGRTEATGMGVYFVIKEALSHAEDMKKLGLTSTVEGKRAVVQGDLQLLIFLFFGAWEG